MNGFTNHIHGLVSIRSFIQRIIQTGGEYAVIGHIGLYRIKRGSWLQNGVDNAVNCEIFGRHVDKWRMQRFLLYLRGMLVVVC